MSKLCRKNNYNSGFTILEMIIVIALFSLIIGLSTSVVKQSGGRLEVETAMLSLCRSLRAAHSYAMAKNTDYTFVIDTYKKSFMIQGFKETFISPNISLIVKTAKYGLQESTLKTIIFFPDNTASGGDLILKNSKYKAEISINWLTSEVSCSLT